MVFFFIGYPASVVYMKGCFPVAIQLKMNATPKSIMRIKAQDSYIQEKVGLKFAGPK